MKRPATETKRWFLNRGDAPSVHSHEFLPAALEIMDTPPSPIGRALLWLVVLFFTLGLVWASVGKVDVVAVSRGKIIPAGRVKVIQPPDAGVITRIAVEEGQRVARGDVLVELDPTSIDADQRRLSSDLQLTLVEIGRLRQLLDLSRQRVVPRQVALQSVNAEQMDSGMLATQQQLLRDELSSYYADLDALDNSIRRRRAELQASAALVTKYRSTIPLVETRESALKRLFEQKLAAENDYLRLKQELLELRQDLLAEDSRHQEIEAAIQESIARKTGTIAEFQAKVLARISERERQAKSIREEQVKNRQRSVRQVLRAPIAGLVQQLRVHTVGGVVTPAQQLMVIVPGDQRLEVESWIENKDIGFVREGQTAVVKVDAFPFTRYGTITGEIITISRDAIQQDAVGLVYSARVTMEQNHIQANGQPVTLGPGMAVTVEIRTGERRLIEYFLSPLLKFKDESIRER